MPEKKGHLNQGIVLVGQMGRRVPGYESFPGIRRAQLWSHHSVSSHGRKKNG